MGEIFSKPKAPPPPPAIQPPALMPDPANATAAKTAQIAALEQRSGRASTVLTDNSNKLGG